VREPVYDASRLDRARFALPHLAWRSNGQHRFFTYNASIEGDPAPGELAISWSSADIVGQVMTLEAIRPRMVRAS